MLNTHGIATIPEMISPVPPAPPSGRYRPMPYPDWLPDGDRTQRVFAAAQAAARLCPHVDPAGVPGATPTRGCVGCVTAAVVAVIDPPGGPTTVPTINPSGRVAAYGPPVFREEDRSDWRR